MTITNLKNKIKTAKGKELDTLLDEYYKIQNKKNKEVINQLCTSISEVSKKLIILDANLELRQEELQTLLDDDDFYAENVIDNSYSNSDTGHNSVEDKTYSDEWLAVEQELEEINQKLCYV